MLQICTDFFKLNDIKVNIKKYELVKINNAEKELIIKNQIINKFNYLQGNRFLDIFFYSKTKRKVYVNKILLIVQSFIKIYNWKYLTEKQAIYIWNTVFIPYIKYQLSVV